MTKVNILREQGLSYFLRSGIEHTLLHSQISNTISKRFYWSLAPEVYRRVHRPEFSLPINPLAVNYVQTEQIERVSGRQWPRLFRAPKELGSTMSGDWDCDPYPDTEPGYTGSPPDLYQAPTFEETIMHQSLKQRFVHGNKWEETAVYREALSLLDGESDFAWRGMKTREEIDQRCNEIDKLYESIKKEGYKTQKQLINENKQNRGLTYLDIITNEIMIDVGRDGSLLHVDGYHRLSIAKILGIREIPVTIVVRHQDWIDYLEELDQLPVNERRSRKTDMSHPDLRSLL